MAEFTFLEVHLHDSTITANAPFSGEATVHDDEESEDEENDESDQRGGGGLPLKPFLALAVLVVAAVAVKKLLSGDGLEEDIAEVDLD